MQAANDLLSLQIYTSLPAPSFLDHGMNDSTKIKSAIQRIDVLNTNGNVPIKQAK